MRKRALVTGVAGFIGSNLADKLISQGWSVTGVDDLSTGTLANVNSKVRFFRDDIRNFTKLYSIFLQGKFDVVFHMAALARIQPSIDDPLTANSVNLTGSLNVLEAARKTKTKVIFAGSSSIYGTTDVMPTPEVTAKDPGSPYALQKWIVEQYLEMYGKLYGLEYVVCRFFNVYGPRQILSGAYAAVVGIFLDQKAKGEPLTITGDGHRRRDFTHVDDICDGLIIAVDEVPGLIMNLGNGSNISVKELADLISPNQVYLPDRQGEAEATLCDNTVAKICGWKPKYTIQNFLSNELKDQLWRCLCIRYTGSWPSYQV